MAMAQRVQDGAAPAPFMRFARTLVSSLALVGAVSLPAQTGTPVSPDFGSAPAPRRLERLTLPEAIERALAQNFTIRLAGFDAAISAAGVTTALGKFDPVLTGRFTKSEAENPQLLDVSSSLRPAATRSLTDEAQLTVDGLLPWGLSYSLGASRTNTRGTFNLFADSFTTFAGVSGRQPLLRDFGFGPTLASLRIAQRNRAIGEWEFRQQVIDTVTRVTLAYHELNFAHASLRSAQRSRELAAGLVRENEARFRVGRVSEFDVTSARSRLASREENILIAERRLRDAENFLKQLISNERTPALLDYGFDIEPPVAPPPVPVDAATDFRLALEKRPDYQQARLALERAEIGHRLARNQLLPRVDLVGSYGYAGLDADAGVSRRMVRAEDHPAYSYGIAVSVPLSSTAERGRYRAARLDRRAAETNLQRVEQDIVVRLGNAAGQLETTRRRVASTRAARELGQLTLEAEEKRLRAGTGSTFFVAQQQEVVTALEISELRAQTDYLNAAAEYDRQLGITLDKLGLTLETPR